MLICYKKKLWEIFNYVWTRLVDLLLVYPSLSLFQALGSWGRAFQALGSWGRAKTKEEKTRED